MWKYGHRHGAWHFEGTEGVAGGDSGIETSYGAAAAIAAVVGDQYHDR